MCFKWASMHVAHITRSSGRWLLNAGQAAFSSWDYSSPIGLQALDTLPGKGVNEAPLAQRPRRAVPKMNYSLAKADADYRASIAEARRAASAAASGRRGARRAACDGSSAAAGGGGGRRRTAAETAAAGKDAGDGPVRHTVPYNTTPGTSNASWVAAGEAADKHLESLGEGAIACAVVRTCTLWLLRERGLVCKLLFMTLVHVKPMQAPLLHAGSWHGWGHPSCLCTCTTPRLKGSDHLSQYPLDAPS